jgi:Protein of unknown function (DUF2911)
MHVRIAALATALGLSVTAFAQTPSPRGAASATVNGKKITIDYGRPALKGRKLDELLKKLPADRVWRAGENQVSTLTTETDLVIGGKKVPAGKYSLYVHAPATGDWALILNTDHGIALGKIWDKAPANLKEEPWPHIDDYTASVGTKEVVRAGMKAGVAKAPAEQFTIGLAPSKGGADLTLAWADKSYSLDLKTAK